MNSVFLGKIGLGSIDIGLMVLILFVMVIVAVVLLIITLVQYRKLNEKYNKFMCGEDACSLEDKIQSLIENVEILNDESAAHTEDINTIFNKHEYAYQKMGLIKYDAYKEMGGKLSYALTLLDEQDSGFIINSVHSSTGCYSYTKRIKGGVCDLDLSPEEQASLDKAVALK